MISEKVRELIDRSVDGETSAEELTKLNNILAVDEAARTYYEEVSQVVNLLEAIPEGTPPVDLKHEIMSAILDDRTTVVRDRKWYEPILEAFRPPRHRAVFSFAGGAGLGLFAAWIILGGNTWTVPGQDRAAVGTMSPLVDTKLLETVDRFEVPVQGGSAVVETKQGEGLVAAEVTVQSSSELEITLELNPTETQAVGYTHLAEGQVPSHVEIELNRVKLTQIGETKVLIVLRPITTAPGHLEVTVEDGDRSQQGKLKTPRS
ncbi:MAG: hypothetical protein HKN21_11745 [Candidatus Eisenbacteria bacterium]|uniref:Uncharacterized protein n=1 Tax=Eiseniibacteriota bacterium TaxID=2212470 RepID=A0A7Y2E907_UNCEI|nr:hypothetical protein [Candidatus Eisenbacteria bacterium]